MIAFILSNENGKFKMEIKLFRVEGLATQIWIATHYLRTSDLRDYLRIEDPLNIPVNSSSRNKTDFVFKVSLSK